MFCQQNSKSYNATYPWVYQNKNAFWQIFFPNYVGMTQFNPTTEQFCRQVLYPAQGTWNGSATLRQWVHLTYMLFIKPNVISTTGNKILKSPVHPDFLVIQIDLLSNWSWQLRFHCNFYSFHDLLILKVLKQTGQDTLSS